MANKNLITKLDLVESLEELIEYIHYCPEKTWKLIDKYNDFSLSYSREKDTTKKAIIKMKAYLRGI